MSGRRGALLAIVALLATAAPSGAALLDHEYISAYTQIGRMRMLTQRISKQNVLYQLHLADQHKLELLQTVKKVNETLEMLRTGSPMVGVPAPPTAEIAAQLEVVALAWAPLETLAMASPYDYLRQSQQFMKARNRRGDPLLIGHFDQLAATLDEQLVAVLALYIASCEGDGYKRCELGEAAHITEVNLERLVKESVLVYAGIDVEENEAKLQSTRAAVAEVILRSGNSEVLVEVKQVLEDGENPARTSQSKVIAQLGEEITSSWVRLDREVELVARGHAEEANLRRALSLQQLMVGDIQKLSVAIEQTTNVGTLR